MNADYVISVATRRGRTWRYAKEDDGWTQTALTGLVRRLSAEQLLSHLLPPLSGEQPSLSVRVERRVPKGRPDRATNGGVGVERRNRWVELLERSLILLNDGEDA